MLTIFASPKSFVDDHIRTIQRNAIRSWLQLTPRPQIILFGDEAGTVEICAEFSLAHVPVVERNEFGTPLVNDIFAKAEALAKGDLLCYCNADIILMNDFSAAVAAVAASKHRFLMGGRPRNLPINEQLTYDQGWPDALAGCAAREGELRGDCACDYFVFPRGLWGKLPPYAIGRAFFDNALLYRARRSSAALIDATYAVVAVHQNHGYPLHLAAENYLSNKEALRNAQLAGGTGHLLGWRNATHEVHDGHVKFNVVGYLNVLGPFSRVVQGWHKLIRFPILDITRTLRRRLGLRKRGGSASVSSSAD